MEEIIHSNGKRFFIFFFVCLYNFPSPYCVGRFRGIKNTSHLFEKVFDIFAASLFYIWFGLDFGVIKTHYKYQYH